VLQVFRGGRGWSKSFVAVSDPHTSSRHESHRRLGPVGLRAPSQRRRLAALALLVVAVLVGGTLALAGKGVRATFGSSGSSEGQFAGIGGLAVNTGSTDVYVADVGNNRVQLILADGSFWGLWGWGVADGSEALQLCNFACLAGLAGGGAGQLSSPAGVAVNQTTQDVYVLDRDNFRVQQYDAVGNFIRAWGWGVLDGTETLQVCDAPGPCQAGIPGSGDGQLGPTGVSPGLAINPSTGDVLVADPGNSRIQRFDASGGFVDAFGTAGSGDGEFGADSPTGLAVDSTGDLYAVDPGNERVQRFDAAGTFETVFADSVLSGAPAPEQVAVNTTDDHVFVAKGCTPSLCADGPDVADERRIFELDPTGTLVDGTHAANAGIGPTSGMALNSTNGRIYLASGDQVFILEDIQAPTVTDVVVANPGATTAWFSATINPNGSPTSYRFEYSTNGTDWTPVTPTDQDAGAGTDPIDVNAFVTGLKGDTDYQARIVATKPFGNPGATSTSTPFSTQALAPMLTLGSTTATQDQTDHGRRQVTLRMRIHPQGQPTSYQFQFGPDTGYGTTVPATPEPIGDGDEWVLIQQTVSDLDPHATYHYQLVATNPTGQTAGDDHTVQTGPGLPDNRAYEQVSPVEKNGNNIMADSARTRAAGNGDAVQYSSLGAFADAEGTGIATEYIAKRTDTGWKTHSITPLQDLQTYVQYLGGAQEPRYMDEFTDDLSAGLFVSKTNLDGPPNVTARFHFFSRNDLLTPGPGDYDLVTDAVQPVASSNYQPFLAGSSDDLTHVVFSANARLTADTPICPTNALGVPNCPRRVYEWIRGGGVRLAGILPASEGGGAAPSSFAGRQNATTLFYAYGPVSRDGRRIFFIASANSGALYMREDGVTTIKVNASEKPFPDDPQPAEFWAASADGSKVFFTTEEQLTDTPGSGLYRWDADAPPGARLTLLSIDREPNDSGTTVASVSGVLGASADGAYVYFIDANQLVAGGPRHEPGDNFVYVWHNGALKIVGSFDAQDKIFNLASNAGLTRKSSRVASSGALLFISRSQQHLVDYPNGSCDDVGCAQVYVYQPQPGGGTGRLLCVSCRPDGATAAAGADVMFRVATGGTGASTHLPRVISDDGRRVVFATAESLVPEDRNAGRHDVYLYDTLSGQLSLISAGTGESDAYPTDISRTGDDIFFLARNRLVGWDVDDNVDLYDARVGGGFPEPVIAQPPCLGGACRGALGSAPGDSTPGSLTANEPRGPSLGGVATFHAHALSRSKLRRLAAGSPVRLLVDVSERGRVRVRMRGRVGGRARLVAAGSRLARRGGTVGVRLRLSPAALRHLHAHDRLRLTVLVSFSPVIGAQRARLTLHAHQGATR
jgi:hypothetical protein